MRLDTCESAQPSAKQTGRQAGRQAGRLADRQTDTVSQKDRQADRQAGRKAGRQTGRQADRAALIHGRINGDLPPVFLAVKYEPIFRLRESFDGLKRQAAAAVCAAHLTNSRKVR